MSESVDIDKVKSTAYEQLLLTLPAVAQTIVQKILDSAPVDVRQELNMQLSTVQKLTSKDPRVYGDLLSMVKRLADPAVRPISDIAIVGSINVGKSTLYNAMLAGTCEPAPASPIPGTTKANQKGELGLFSLIDTPGFAHGCEAGVAESQEASWACQESNFLIVVFDASRGITNDDRQLYDYVVSLNKPHVVALNKIDIISPKDLPNIISSCAASLRISTDAVIPVSAEKRKGIQCLLLAAAATEPRLLAELGRNIPELRSKLAWQAIRRSAIAAAGVTLMPLPFVDFIPLTAIQAALVVTVARIYDKPMNKARALEALSSLGFGVAGRTLFQELVKLGGPPGWAISVSVATATTIAIGFCAIEWFSTGIIPDSASVKRMGSEVQKRLLNFNAFKLKKKPKTAEFEEQVTQSLKHLTQELADAQLKKADAVDNPVPPAPRKE